MNAEIKALWLAALRSGAYEQVQGTLRMDVEDSPRFCCLGVLCDLHARATGGTWTSPSWELVRYDGDNTGLPASVQMWAGLDRRYPLIDQIDITHYNDGESDGVSSIAPHSFTEIADLIERHL